MMELLLFGFSGVVHNLVKRLRWTIEIFVPSLIRTTLSGVRRMLKLASHNCLSEIRTILVRLGQVVDLRVFSRKSIR